MYKNIPMSFDVFLKGLKVGDNRIWDLFYQKYNNIFIYYFKRYASNMSCEDLISIVYFKLVENDFFRIKKFIGNSEVAFKSYLLKTAKYVIWSESKKIKTFINIDDVDINHILFYKNDNNYSLNIENWNYAISELSPIRREIINMLLLGHKRRDIAQKLNITIGSLGSHISRSKPILRRKLTSYLT